MQRESINQCRPAGVPHGEEDCKDSYRNNLMASCKFLGLRVSGSASFVLGDTSDCFPVFLPRSHQRAWTVP